MTRLERLNSCGMQGIALRRHRDDRKSMEDIPCANDGNFLLSNICPPVVKCGDNVLAELLQSANRNVLSIILKLIKVYVCAYICIH